MPIGMTIDVTAVVLGGLAGSIAGKRLSGSLKDTMNAVLGLCALCMGISAVVLVMPVSFLWTTYLLPLMA